MTFDAPRSSGRIVTLVLKRLVMSRTSLVVAAALISSSVVLAGRSDGEMTLTPGAILQEESLVLRQLDLPTKTANSPDPANEPVTVASQPAVLSLRPMTDDADLSPTESTAAEDAARTYKQPDRAVPSSGDSLAPEIMAIVREEATVEPAQPPRTVDVAMLESASALDFHDHTTEPRAPEFGPIPIIPAVARAPDVIEEPALDFLTSGPFVISLAAENGESLDDIMQRSGMSDEDRMATLVALRADMVEESMMDGDLVDLAFLGKNDRDLLGIRLRQLGQLPVELRWDEETVPLWASLAPLDTVFSELEPEEAAPTLSVTGKPDDTVFFAGEINSSLYQSAKKAGLSARQTKAVENIFRYSIDFQRDLRKGDYFEVLFEKQDDGTTGDILYTKLNNRGSEIALYLGIDDLTGLSGYFDATGKSNKRSLMRTPISGARISSHFGMRHHPILGYNKMHRGTDFAAPRGTPIFAAGDGVIEYLGRNGAYGKYIRIRHNNIYKTAYAHMSRYAPGLLNGSRVRQGDVIGYVGSTGRSTGPHLHFEILENDNRINPMQVADFGPVQGLSSTALTNFLVRVSRIEVALSLLRDNVRVAEAE